MSPGGSEGVGGPYCGEMKRRNGGGTGVVGVLSLSLPPLPSLSFER